MYRAKEHGRNNFQFFTDELNALMTERLELESNLRRALEREQFELHYQPRVDIGTRRITGAEALIRWHVPERGMIAAGALHSDRRRDRLDRARSAAGCCETRARRTRRGRMQGCTPCVVSVNVSARQFRQDDLVQTIAEVLDETGLERALPRNRAHREHGHARRRALHRDAARSSSELGVQIAVDDFGTGYSSLSYLKRFPVDRLKVDRSFVQDIATTTTTRPSCGTIIALGHNLGLKVVAEGVETEQQLEFLRANQCDELQGYYFGRPMPADEFRLLFSNTGSLIASRCRHVALRT